MNTESNIALIDLLKKEEGFTPIPVKDIGGWEIGYGHWMVKRMINYTTEEEAAAQLIKDIKLAEEGIGRFFPLYPAYTQARQNALLAMAYQMGADIFHHFPKAVNHVRRAEWKEAANDFRDSIWAKTQTPARAERVCKMIEEG